MVWTGGLKIRDRRAHDLGWVLFGPCGDDLNFVFGVRHDFVVDGAAADAAVFNEGLRFFQGSISNSTVSPQYGH